MPKHSSKDNANGKNVNWNNVNWNNKNDKTMLKSENAALAVNLISERSARDQVSRAPDSKQKGKSEYPHQYQDHENIVPKRNGSVSTEYYEYPVMQDGKNYGYGVKPKPNPGPYRAITNQNKDFKCVICHDGVAGNPNAGAFHICKK